VKNVRKPQAGRRGDFLTHTVYRVLKWLQLRSLLASCSWDNKPLNSTQLNSLHVHCVTEISMVVYSFCTKIGRSNAVDRNCCQDAKSRHWCIIT